MMLLRCFTTVTSAAAYCTVFIYCTVLIYYYCTYVLYCTDLLSVKRDLVCVKRDLLYYCTYLLYCTDDAAALLYYCY
jgi:hypothetical protein